MDVTSVTDGNLVDWSHRGVPPYIECYAHDGGIIAFWHVGKRVHVDVQIVGLTEGEIDRAIRVAVMMLNDAPGNRAQRRAQDADMRHVQ